MVVAHAQHLRELPLPGGQGLAGPPEHDVHRHAAGAQPAGLGEGPQGMLGVVVPAQEFEILVLQRLRDWKREKTIFIIILNYDYFSEIYWFLIFI